MPKLATHPPPALPFRWSQTTSASSKCPRGSLLPLPVDCRLPLDLLLLGPLPCQVGCLDTCSSFTCCCYCHTFSAPSYTRASAAAASKAPHHLPPGRLCTTCPQQGSAPPSFFSHWQLPLPLAVIVKGRIVCFFKEFLPTLRMGNNIMMQGIRSL